MHTKLSIVFLLLCFIFLGCTEMPEKLKSAQEVMERYPDSALRILQNIPPENLSKDADRAYYGILLFQALDKNNLALQPDSIITFSVNYFLEKNDSKELAISYYYKARVYKKAQRFDEATVLYLKALDIAKGSKDFNILGQIYSDLGEICILQNDYNESIKKFNESITQFRLAGDSLGASYRIISLGKAYHFKKEFGKADKNYRLALINTKDSMLIGFAYQELGLNFYYSKQIDSAYFYLKKSLDFPYNGTNYAIRCLNLGELFFDIEQYDSASFYAKLALKYPSTYFNQRDCYRILANTEYTKGNLDKLAAYMAKYQDCTDSVRRVEHQTKSKILEDIHVKKNQIKKSNNFLVVSIISIVIIIFFSLKIFLKLRKKDKIKDIKLVEVEHKLVKNQVLMKDSLADKIKENKELRANDFKKASFKDRELITKDIYNFCLHLNDWNLFEKLMNETFNNMIFSLTKEYPDINKKELIWCTLSLLEISSADMAIILDLQQGSIYKMKQRLAQKLKLSSTKDLDLLLLSLSTSK